MSTYEVLTLLILFGTFLISLLAYIDRISEYENQQHFLNPQELVIRIISKNGHMEKIYYNQGIFQ